MLINFLKISKCVFLWAQSHYVTRIQIQDQSLCLLLLNQGHHRNIHYNTTLFHIDFMDSFLVIAIQTFVRFSKFPLPLVWEQFCWFAHHLSFLLSVRIFIFFLLSLIANNMCAEHENISIS